MMSIRFMISFQFNDDFTLLPYHLERFASR
ncbi:hypothetical protein LMG9964_02272 [Paraburkholderia phenoliruptrix]|uniref:Uncharacterized protein n=1 Tax=Paraburkholderia phenoliruptrix TaxID=252970 RepID=A0A6J5K3T5_9BURK|nr:hypothetical protein LMG9964_02272 [Paraburkholderia phenoliruptrix]